MINNEVKGAIESVFHKHPVMVAGPVNRDEVLTLEAFAGFVLSSDYKTFVECYGGAIVGSYPIYGCRQAPAMARNEASAIAVTKRFREEDWPGISDWLIISTNLSGSPIGLVPNGEVWISDHEWNIVERVAATFTGFLERQCLKRHLI